MHTVEYYSALKRRKEVLTPAAMWMDLENMMLREISQTEKDKYCTILFIGSTWNSQGHSGYQSLGGGSRELLVCRLHFQVGMLDSAHACTA